MRYGRNRKLQILLTVIFYTLFFILLYECDLNRANVNYYNLQYKHHEKSKITSWQKLIHICIFSSIFLGFRYNFSRSSIINSINVKHAFLINITYNETYINFFFSPN